MRPVRLRYTLAGVLVLYACLLIGIVTSYVLVRELVIRSTEKNLIELNQNNLALIEQKTEERRSTLAALNRSKAARCSAQDLEEMRRLVFQSSWLKDAGRFAAGHLICSAEVSDDHLTRLRLQPQSKTPDGEQIYTEGGELGIHHEATVVVQQGDAYVDTGLLLHKHIGVEGVQTFESIRDASGSYVSYPSPGLRDVYSMPDVGRRQGNLYATACSLARERCLTAVEPISFALRSERSLMQSGGFWGGGGGGGLGGGGVVWGGGGGAGGGAGGAPSLGGGAPPRAPPPPPTLEGQLQRAIRDDELYLEYQPIVSMQDRRILGLEALCRWKDEHGQAISPEVFIRIAEDRQWIHALTLNIFKRALEEWGSFLNRNPWFRLCLNLSAYSLDEPDFAGFLHHLLQRHAVLPQCVVIEITESAMANDPRMIEQIQRLRAMGHLVHLDDFGTGYCSLSYLHELKVDAIKIDRVFTRAIGTGSVTTGILPQILSIAESQQLDVIVEGVEEEAQAEYLAAMPFSGAMMGQGWLFGRPTSARNVGETIRQQMAEHAADSQTDALACP